MYHTYFINNPWLNLITKWLIGTACSPNGIQLDVNMISKCYEIFISYQDNYLPERETDNLQSRPNGPNKKDNKYVAFVSTRISQHASGLSPLDCGWSPTTKLGSSYICPANSLMKIYNLQISITGTKPLFLNKRYQDEYSMLITCSTASVSLRA